MYSQNNEEQVILDYFGNKIGNLLDFPIEDYQACLAMVEVKLSRIQESPGHIDSYIDACAYLALACELKTEENELYV